MVPLTLLKLHLLLPGFALVLFRVMGLMVTAPLFGSSAIPARFKVAMAMTIAAVLFPMVGPTLPADITLNTALVGVFGEMMIGLVIGLAMTLALNGVQLTGMMIGGVTPFGLPEEMSTYADPKLLDLDYIILGSGSRSSKLRVEPSVLNRVPNLEFIDGLSLASPQ